MASALFRGYAEEVLTHKLSRRTFAFSSLAAAFSFLAAHALAQRRGRGRIRCVRRRLREHNKAWRLLMLVELPKAPKKPEVLLRFKLTQTIEFLPGESDDNPQRRALDPPRTIVRERSVEMRDVRGRVGRRTRAGLLLERTDGFGAGIWQLQVHDPNSQVGHQVELTLHSANTVSPSTPEEDAGSDAGSGADGGDGTPHSNT